MYGANVLGENFNKQTEYAGFKFKLDGENLFVRIQFENGIYIEQQYIIGAKGTQLKRDNLAGPYMRAENCEVQLDHNSCNLEKNMSNPFFFNDYQVTKVMDGKSIVHKIHKGIVAELDIRGQVQYTTISLQ